MIREGTPPVAADPLPLRDLATLDRAVGGSLILPSDDRYDSVRRVWNSRIDHRPTAVVRCRNAGDVQVSIDFARAAGIPLSIKGSGHHVSGSAVCHGGLVIDLSAMKGVVVDPRARVLRAEPGLTWGEVDRATQSWGLATTGAQVSTVGIGGVTLGGGMGWLMRSHGLSLDNLLAAEIVLADGTRVTASARERPDLFWGIRGGAGNFGVVTSFEYRLHPVGPLVVGGMVAHLVEQAAPLIRFYRDFVAEAPDELGSQVTFWKAPPLPFLPVELHGKGLVSIVVCHSGEVKRGLATVRPLREFGRPVIDQVGPLPYTVLERMFDHAGRYGHQVHMRGGHLLRLDDETIDVLVAAARLMPTMLSALIVFPLGGAVARVPDSETAFGHRQAAFTFGAKSVWRQPEQAAAGIEWADTIAEALAGRSHGTYVNEIAGGTQASVRTAYDEATFARLQALKTEYDPSNVFAGAVNIPPAQR